jgi:VWFA-related protein
MQKQQGRKALILLTDGEDNGSKISVTEAIATSQRADTLAYSVRIADERQFNPGFSPGMGRHGGMGGGGWGRPGPMPHQIRPDGKKILQQISRETGGAYFEISKKTTVKAIYGEIEEELRNQYSIGYTSDRRSADDQFRTIQLRVKRKGLVVRARAGYYPAPSS